MSYEGRLVLPNVLNIIYIFKILKKIQRKFFVFEIIVS